MSVSENPAAPASRNPLLPPQMATACEQVGVRKANFDLISMFVLPGLAGAFIALGAMLFTAAVTASDSGYGPTGLLGGRGVQPAIQIYAGAVTQRSRFCRERGMPEDPTVVSGEHVEEFIRLRLIFTCCHPALAPDARVALTLRTLGGLTTAESARFPCA